MNTGRTRYAQGATRSLPSRLHRAILLSLLVLITGVVMALAACAARAQTGSVINAGGIVYTGERS